MIKLLCTKEVPLMIVFTKGNEYSVKKHTYNANKTGGMMDIMTNQRQGNQKPKQREFRVSGNKILSSGYEFTVIVTNKGDDEV